MRNILFFMLALTLVFAACNKSNKCPYTPSTAVAGTAEVTKLKAWLDSSALPYTQTPSGVFYNITNAGSGSTPGVCSGVTVIIFLCKFLGEATKAVINSKGSDDPF